MKNFKKLLAVALTAVMALAVFTACGKDSFSYSKLTNKLNAAIGTEYTYSSENTVDANNYYNNAVQNAKIYADAAEEMKEAGDDYEKMAGIYAEMERKFADLPTYTKGKAYDIIPIEGTDLSESQVVEKIKDRVKTMTVNGKVVDGTGNIGIKVIEPDTFYMITGVDENYFPVVTEYKGYTIVAVAIG